LITHLGALGVFLLMVPESACIPIPSEATLLFSGVAVHQGWMSFALAVAAATAGNLVGSLLAYGVGATHAVDRVPGARQIVARWGTQLEQHGSRAVLIARLLPLARTFVALPAGARRVPLAPFAGYTVLGSAIWAATFIGLGTLMANAWAVLGSVLGRGLLVVGVITVAVITHRGRKRRQQTDANRAEC
jgi:membrane protein DedA with SNARE-associated domain